MIVISDNDINLERALVIVSRELKIAAKGMREKERENPNMVCAANAIADEIDNAAKIINHHLDINTMTCQNCRHISKSKCSVCGTMSFCDWCDRCVLGCETAKD